MKLNNKGFMMAEVVVVSAIILIFMTAMFSSYNKIFAIYKERVSYYDVNALYQLAYYRDSLDTIKEATNGLSDTNFANIVSGTDEGDTLIVVRNYGVDGAINKTLSANQVEAITSATTHQGLIDYVNFVSTHVTLTGRYLLVLEDCKSDDIDACKYAYLDFYGSGN